MLLFVSYFTHGTNKTNSRTVELHGILDNTRLTAWGIYDPQGNRDPVFMSFSELKVSIRLIS